MLTVKNDQLALTKNDGAYQASRLEGGFGFRCVDGPSFLPGLGKTGVVGESIEPGISDLDVADAPSITGTPTVTGGALPVGLVWDTSSFTTNGTIKVVAAGAGPYATWATSKGLTVANNGANQDPDLDTVSNLVEFVLGGQPNPANPNANSTGLLPVVSTPGGNLVFSFTRDPQSKVAELALSIRVGTDLLTFPDVYVVGNDTASSTAGVTVTGDVVTLTIPQAPNTKKFARLNAVYTAP